jgi:hypothetical protein
LEEVRQYKKAQKRITTLSQNPGAAREMQLKGAREESRKFFDEARHISENVFFHQKN